MKNAPLKHLVMINKETLDETTDPDFEFRYIDIGSVGRGVLLEEPELLNFGQAPSRARRVVRARDTLISTVRTYLRAVLPIREVTSTVIGSTGFAVLTPGPDVDARYLGWLAQSDLVVEEVVARSVGVSYPAVNPFEIGNIRVPVFPLPTQRLIADFLDTETARIDALIAKKHALINLVRKRQASVVDSVLWSQPYATARLKHLAGRPTSGNRDHTFTWSDEGIPCLRGLNIRPMRIDRSNLLRISTVDAIRHSATALRPDDIVVVRSGNAGAAAVVPNDLDGANCVDLIVIRRTPALLSNIIAWTINSDRTAAGVIAGSDNAALRHFNADDAAELLVPVPPLDKQPELERTLMRITQTQDRLIAALEDHIRLLQERRQASITAAVTGKLDILGAVA